MPQILPDQILIHRQLQSIAGYQHSGKVLPAAGCHKAGAVHILFHFVKMLGTQFQICQYRGMQPVGTGVLLPGGQIRFQINAAHAVQRDKVKFPHTLVVFRRVAGR